MPRKKGPVKRQVNVRLDLATIRELKRLAQLSKMTRTDLITQIVWTQKAV